MKILCSLTWNNNKKKLEVIVFMIEAKIYGLLRKNSGSDKFEVKFNIFFVIVQKFTFNDKIYYSFLASFSYKYEVCTTKIDHCRAMSIKLSMLGHGS